MKQGIKLVLPLEFDFKKNLAYLARTNNEVMYHLKGEVMYHAVSFAAGLGLVAVRYLPSHELLVTLENDIVLTQEELGILIAEITDFFDLTRDLRPFYQLVAADDILQGLEVEQFGLRLIGVPNFFEAMAWGILGQQINLGFAYTLKRRLVETYGQSLTVAGETYWVFPTPQVIADLTVADLQTLQLSQRKAEYLLNVAQLLVKGEISKEFYLALKTPTKIERELTKLRGIGPWTANYVMMRCLRVPSAFPAKDIGLLNALKVRQGLSQKPVLTDVLQLGKKWDQWASYGTFYLWRTIY